MKRRITVCVLGIALLLSCIAPAFAHSWNEEQAEDKRTVPLSTQLLSLTPVDMSQVPMTLAAEVDDWDNIPGYTEYLFWAEYLHEDGHTSIEMISLVVEDSSD